MRTLPVTMPQFRTSEFNTYKPVSAELLRRLAQAQNFLWANTLRVYANSACEGHGCLSVYGKLDLDAEQSPVWWRGLRVASFLAPTGITASNRLKIMGRVVCKMIAQTPDVDAVGVMAFSVWNLDGTPTGIYREHVVTPHGNAAHGTFDFTTYLVLPSDGKDYEIRAHVTLLGRQPNVDEIKVKHISARYAEATIAELGQALEQFRPHGGATAADHHDESVAAMFLNYVAKNTLVMWATRGPEICQSWLDLSYTYATTYTEVGRYKVFIAPPCSKLGLAVRTAGTNLARAGTGFRVLVNGFVVWTSLGNTATLQEEFVNAIPGTEATITVEAVVDAAGGGTEYMDVLGFSAYESNSNFSALLDGGQDVYIYTPVDESRLLTNGTIHADEDGDGFRSGVMNIVDNDVFLAKYRMRGLVGDWRHRILKRYNLESTGAPNPGIQWDWTPGTTAATYYSERPKNITVRGYGDDNAAYNDMDAHPAHLYGFSTQFNIGDFADWPAVSLQNYPGTAHGRRLAVFEARSTGSEIQATDDGKFRALFRARRLRPGGPTGFRWRGVVHPNIGPAAEEDKWTGQAYLVVRAQGTLSTLQTVNLSIGGAYGAPDNELGWYGPLVLPHGVGTGRLVVHGRCPNKLGVGAGDEGNYFEVELAGVFSMDLPLSQAQLDAIL